MPSDLPAVPGPLPGDYHPGHRLSLCGEALAPVLAALAQQAEAAGWAPREVAAAMILWGSTRAAQVGGPEEAAEALMLAMDMARMRGPNE